MKAKLKVIEGHLMTGISYILPVIIGASLIVGLAKLVGLGFGVSDLNTYKDAGGILHGAYLMEQVGWTGIGLMNVLLAGFIAYSIADKSGLAAGFIGGALASSTNAGFIGAVIAGFFAGYVALFVKRKIQIQGSAAGLVPLLILPLITVGLTGLLMSVLLGGPLGALNTALIEWIKGMVADGTSTLALALILGAMIGFDLGGPVNKSAWMAGNALFLSGVYLPAILVNIAIVIPPLGYGLATLIRKRNFSPTFREAGRGGLVMGIIGITEGAIPFTLVNLKLIPLNVVACAVGSGVAALLGVHDIMPPIGGLYGFFSVGNWWAYLIGALTGALVIGIGANLLVNFSEKKKSQKRRNMIRSRKKKTILTLC
ncbi:PTS fructose transporter subunit IIC [Bacillus safensis]|uniref:PTS fructose transporter subunit IIC n=1 Tax=Bacillus safensis TaxID=561879 RepID=A0A5S9LZI7_BACIA|nr:PTS fructose transporter subunit IIC [Bacillus safensis]